MIVQSEQFDLQPLTPDEATVELELIGHDFFVSSISRPAGRTSSTAAATARTG